MPKEAFGGDDGGGGAAAPGKRKMGLDKFGLSPDANIRDVFWKVLGGYAAAKKPGADLARLADDRFALIRVAISVLGSQQHEHYGLAPKFIAIYTIMMIGDGGWTDALPEFLEAASEKKLGIRKDVAGAMKKLLPQEPYGKMLAECLAHMIRGRSRGSVALGYLAELGSAELALAMKKELMIIARGDIGEDQQNAIKAVSFIKDDEEVRKTLIVLLSHWDAQARLAAAEVLAGRGPDSEAAAAAERRLQSETDEDVKRCLERIAGRK
jgi:hypothetical protein